MDGNRFGNAELQVQGRKEARKRVLQYREDFLKEFKDDEDLIRFYEQLPSSFRDNFIKLKLRKINSPTKRIKMKCLDCSNFCRKEIELCTVNSCPLWEVRPFQNLTK